MFEIDKKSFGEFISMLRKEKSMTQKELASRLIVSDKSVSKWETVCRILHCWFHWRMCLK